jgi:hypothetical protein
MALWLTDLLLPLSERLSPKTKRLLRLLIPALAGIVANGEAAQKAAKLRLNAKPDRRGAGNFIEEGQSFLLKRCPSPIVEINLISLD